MNGIKQRCALCRKEISGESMDFGGFRVCVSHRDELPEGQVVALGHYRREDTAEQRKEAIVNGGLWCVVLESEDPPGFRILVREEDSTKGKEILSRIHREVVLCRGCGLEFSRDLVYCPFCAEKYSPEELQEE